MIQLRLITTIALLLSGLPAFGADATNPELGAPPGTYVAAPDQESFVLPFEFYEMNLMVHAEMNDLPIKMLIDNGVMWDELLFYGSSLVDSLGMEYDGDVLVTGAGDDRDEGAESYTASDVSLSFGDVEFHGQSAVITAKSAGWADYFPGMAGQVCGAFFKHFVVEFDFDHQNLILHKPESFRYAGTGCPVPMTRDEHGSYSIPVRIGLGNGQELDYSLFIDLGGIHPISLVVGAKSPIAKPASEKVILGYGASGEITGYRDKVASLKIGDYELKHVQAVYTESDDEGDYANTTIGLPLLLRFNVVFDYFNERLYLEPNSHFGDGY